jgi:hypothetical protein
MERTGPGRYVSDRSLPVTGRWKTLLRLHGGGEMMAAPVYLPADPDIGAREIPAIDRHVRLSSEKRFLLRETRPGQRWLAIVVDGLLSAVAVGWIAAFTLAARRVGPIARSRRGEARWLRTSANARRAGMPAARASATNSDALLTQKPTPPPGAATPTRPT